MRFFPTAVRSRRENCCRRRGAEGTTPRGSMWAMNPLPAAAGAFDSPCPGRTAVDAPSAYEEWSHNPNECSGNWPTTVYIEDSVRIPSHLTPGEYVLGWRWDW